MIKLLAELETVYSWADKWVEDSYMISRYLIHPHTAYDVEFESYVHSYWNYCGDVYRRVEEDEKLCEMERQERLEALYAKYANRSSEEWGNTSEEEIDEFIDLFLDGEPAYLVRVDTGYPQRRDYNLWGNSLYTAFNEWA